MKLHTLAFSLVLLSLAGQASAQTTPAATKIAEWNFGSTAFDRNDSTLHPAVSPVPLALGTAGGLSLAGAADPAGTGAGFVGSVSGWPAVESSALSLARTSLTSSTSTRVLWSQWLLSANATGDFSSLKLQFRHRRGLNDAAPTQARAWVSWNEGGVIKTRSSLPLTLNSSSTAWTSATLDFPNGTSAFPTGSALAGKSFLVELQCFGGTATSSKLSVDDLALTTGSLSGALPLEIRTAALLPGGYVGRSYAVALSAVGGEVPYTWSITSGTLPAGLTLSSGIISGVPTTAGTSTLTATLTDSKGSTATRALTLNVLPANALMSLGNTVWADINNNGLREPTEPGLAGVTVRLYASTANPATDTPLASTVTNASGIYLFRERSPGTYRLVLMPPAAYPATSGIQVALDNGIDNDNNGLQSGGVGTQVLSPVITLALGTEPVASGDSSGNADLTVDFGLTASSDATLTINPLTLPAAATGSTYVNGLFASGGQAPYTWSVASGSLPAGLALSATTGILSGTVTAAAGIYTFTLQANDIGGIKGTKTYALEVLSPTLTISPPTLPPGMVGVPYSSFFSAVGGTAPYTWSIVSGTLPAGLTLNATTGYLSGLPTISGTSAFAIRTTAANGLTGTRTYQVAVSSAAIMISPASLPPGKVGVAYAQTLTANGGTSPYTWTITGGTLPAGLILNASTGVISGTPQANGTTTAGGSFTVQAADANSQKGYRTYYLGIEAAGISISPTTLPALTQGTATTALTFTATGGTAPYAWAIASGSLPAGLTLTSSGILSGTPTTSGTFSLTLRVTDALGMLGLRTYSLLVNPSTQSLVISPTALPNPVTSQPYTVTFAATGGTAPYVWAITTGSLPTGLTLNTTTGVLSGTPTAATGTISSFRISATAANGTKGQRDYLLVIGSNVEITLSPATLPEATVGTAFASLFTAVGGKAPYLYSIVSGALPAGLTLSSSGMLSGTPTASGSYSFAVRATDANAVTGTRSFTLVVKALANSLGDFVWADLNNNGIKDASESGIAGLEMRLFPATVNPATGTALATVLTSSTGQYTFSNLTPGAYVVAFMPPAAYPAVSSISVTLDNGVNNDNNGFQPGGVGTLVYSPIITLTLGAEPPGGTTSTDNTVDFGLTAATTTAATDFGDLASAGSATTSSLISPNLRLGSLVDAETTVIGNATATTDDVTGSDDEDGVLLPPSIQPGATVTLSVNVFNNTGASAFLHSWIDFNNDGVFNNAVLSTSGGERLEAVRTLPSATSASFQTLTFTVPATASAGTLRGVRFRLTNLSSTTPTGASGTGEVEDYAVTIAATVAYITITPATLPAATAGTSYSQTFTASGGTAPYTWALVAGSLPAGLSLNPSTGLLSGVVTASTGSSTFTLQASDANGSKGSASYSLQVISNPALTLGNLVWADLNNNGLKDAGESGIAGVEMRLFPSTANPATSSPITVTTTDSSGLYSFQIFVPGSYIVAFMPPAAYPAASSVFVALDNGIDNDNNGLQSGGPASLVRSPVITLGLGTEPGSSGTGNADNTVDFGLTAAATTLITVNPASLPTFTVGTAYMQSFMASGGTAPYVWSITSGTLPAGMTLSAAGVLSGTPTTASTASFAVRATDVAGAFGTRSYTLTGCGVITVTPSTLPDFTVGTAASVTLSASGGTAPYTWAVNAGTLPPGLVLTSSGLLSGTPTTAGTFTFSMKCSDAFGCTASRAYALSVKAAGTPITILPSTLPTPTVGTAFMQTFTATGGTAPYIWALSAGNLPPGLALNTATGVLSGTPTTSGSSTFTVRVTDASASTASRSYTLVVGADTAYPSSFVLWQQQAGLTGTPTNDSDADGVIDFLEYALGTPPKQCTGLQGRFLLRKSTPDAALGSSVQAEVIKPATGQNDLVFVLEALGNLADSPAGWRTVTLLPQSQITSDGLMKRIWQRLDASPGTGGTTPQSGFIRLRVLLDADLNGTPEFSAVSPTFGWSRGSAQPGTAFTLGVPFVQPAVYSSQVLTFGSSMLTLGSTGSTMPVSFTSVFGSGQQFYAEVLSGPAEGNRFEIDEALSLTAASNTMPGAVIVLDLANPQNTGTPSSQLLGSRLAIRPHWTLGSAFDPADFLAAPTATADVASSHRLNAFNPATSGYTTYIVAPGLQPKWVLPVSGATQPLELLTDLNGQPIRADEGYIVRTAPGAALNFTLIGQVRDSAFAQPLATGPQLRINPWPMMLTPAQRALSSASGFAAGASAETADAISLFTGGTVSGTDVMTTWFLSNLTGAPVQWQPVTAGTPPLDFAPASAAFFRALAPRPAWVQPRPWMP